MRRELQATSCTLVSPIAAFDGTMISVPYNVLGVENEVFKDLYSDYIADDLKGDCSSATFEATPACCTGNGPVFTEGNIEYPTTEPGGLLWIDWGNGVMAQFNTSKYNFGKSYLTKSFLLNFFRPSLYSPDNIRH